MWLSGLISMPELSQWAHHQLNIIINVSLTTRRNQRGSVLQYIVFDSRSTSEPRSCTVYHTGQKYVLSQVVLPARLQDTSSFGQLRGKQPELVVLPRSVFDHIPTLRILAVPCQPESMWVRDSKRGSFGMIDHHKGCGICKNIGPSAWRSEGLDGNAKITIRNWIK